MIRDLTSWKIAKTLVLFALPMLFGNIIHQLYNIVDTIVVWRYISSAALASVGAAFPAFFLLLSISSWLAAWASVIISQLFWAKDLRNVKKASYTALLSMFVVWIFVCVIWFLLCIPMLKLLNTPVDIFYWAQQYLQIIFWFGVFIFVHNMSTSIFNALWDSKTPLLVMILSALLNIFLDLLFVLVFELWIAGVALATWISWICAMVISTWILLFRIRKIYPERLDKVFDIFLLRSMTKIAVPSMVNQSFVAIWALAVQWVINSFWSDIIAGYAAAYKVDWLALMPLINLSAALAAFSAQNLWSGQINRVKEWFRISRIISVWFAVVMAAVAIFFWDEIIKVFLDSDASVEIVDFWKKYLTVVSFGYILMWFLFNSWSVLRAAWEMRPYVWSTIVSMWAKVSVAYLFAWVLWPSVIWWSVVVSCWVWAVVSMFAYLRWNWQKIKIIGNVNKNFWFSCSLDLIRESLVDTFLHSSEDDLSTIVIPVDKC